MSDTSLYGLDLEYHLESNGGAKPLDLETPPIVCTLVDSPYRVSFTNGINNETIYGKVVGTLTFMGEFACVAYDDPSLAIITYFDECEPHGSITYNGIVPSVNLTRIGD